MEARLEVDFNGNSITLDLIKDTKLEYDAAVEKINIASMYAYYGAIMAYNKRKVNNLDNDLKVKVTSLRAICIQQLNDEEVRVSEAAIWTRTEGHEDYQDLSRELNAAKYIVDVLESAIWALKIKADNIKVLLSVEKYTG